MTETKKAAIDRTQRSVSFERTFAASPEEVFDAWTQPEELTACWDPTGAPLRRCVIDLRPGGAFSFENEGHSPPFAGTYLVVDRPSKLSFEALGAVGTVELSTENGVTTMRVVIRCSSLEHLEQFVRLGVDVNTDRTIDNLVAHMAERRLRHAPSEAAR